MKIDICKLQLLYNDGYSLNSLQKIFDTHCTTLSKYLKNSNININYREKFKLLNQTYFDQIDTEDKAYMLGFIFADGSINLKHNRLSIDLSFRDVDILQKFSKLLYNNDFVKPYTRYNRKYCRLDVHSKMIYNKLLDYNLTPNKSFTITYPEQLNNNLTNHFIRGLIDGDGWIYLPNNNRDSPNVGLICTTQINNYISNILKEKFDIKSYLCKAYKQDINIMCELRIKNYRQTKLLLDWLYKDATIYLQRKYNLYQKFLSKYENLRAQNK